MTLKLNTQINNHQIKLPIWDGPLDLLLDLIKSNEINIYDISIHQITCQYLETIKLLKEIDPNLSSEFLVMATTLVLIKTKMLLPDNYETNDDEFQVDSREGIVQQLITYQSFKEAALKLEDLSNDLESFGFQENVRFSNKIDKIHLFNLKKKQEKNEWNNIHLSDLIKVFSNILEQMEFEEPPLFQDRNIRVEDIIKDISIKLEKEQGKIHFKDLFNQENKRISKRKIIILFWAILEMYKKKQININQDKRFKSIFIVSIK